MHSQPSGMRREWGSQQADPARRRLKCSLRYRCTHSSSPNPHFCIKGPFCSERVRGGRREEETRKEDKGWKEWWWWWWWRWRRRRRRGQRPHRRRSSSSLRRSSASPPSRPTRACPTSGHHVSSPLSRPAAPLRLLHPLSRRTGLPPLNPQPRPLRRPLPSHRRPFSLPPSSPPFPSPQSPPHFPTPLLTVPIIFSMVFYVYLLQAACA